jgi:hypothetical protein
MKDVGVQMIAEYAAACCVCGKGPFGSVEEARVRSNV